MKKRFRQDIFHVPKRLDGQPLAAVLQTWRSETPAADWRRMLKDGHVLIDGNHATNAGLRMKSGQVIKLLAQPRSRVPTEDDVRVVYADADVVVVDKPAGMTSVRHPEEERLPARLRQRQPTLVELLPRILARRERHRARHPVRAVHRLDRDTSGLMIFARNIKAERLLGLQFRDHTIERVYWAIVRGKAEQQTIATRLVRDRGDGRRGSSDHATAGKHAVTHVTPLEQFPQITLVECRLETGRTHQIRIHLAEQGHPVCGDKVYGRSDSRSRLPSSLDCGRLALHAGRLGFTHPASNRSMKFESPLPAEFSALLVAARTSV